MIGTLLNYYVQLYGNLVESIFFYDYTTRFIHRLSLHLRSWTKIKKSDDGRHYCRYGSKHYHSVWFKVKVPNFPTYKKRIEKNCRQTQTIIRSTIIIFFIFTNLEYKLDQKLPLETLYHFYQPCAFINLISNL